MPRVGVLVLVLVAACGSARPEPAGPRRVGPLPPLPPLSRPPAQLETALDRADALLADAPPVAPAGATVDETSAWLVDVFLPWTGAWLDRIQEVSDPLAAASALEPELRVFAASIVALLFEVARARLFEVPVPADIAGDPDATAEWTALLEEATSPAAASARELLAACVELAAGRTDASAWGEDCARRLAALPAAPETETVAPVREDASE